MTWLQPHSCLNHVSYDGSSTLRLGSIQPNLIAKSQASFICRPPRPPVVVALTSDVSANRGVTQFLNNEMDARPILSNAQHIHRDKITVLPPMFPGHTIAQRCTPLHGVIEPGSKSPIFDL